MFSEVVGLVYVNADIMVHAILLNLVDLTFLYFLTLVPSFGFQHWKEQNNAKEET